MEDHEVIKNVSVVWLEKVQGLLCLDGQCCSHTRRLLCNGHLPVVHSIVTCCAEVPCAL